MVAVVQIYRALATGEIAPKEALVRLGGLDLPGTLVDGYARGAAGSLAASA